MSSTQKLDDLIEAAYRDRYPQFVRTLTAILGNGEEARDLVQEAFATGLRQQSDFRAEGDLEGWLWRIALNLARDSLRRRRRSGFELTVVQETGDPDGDIRAALMALPERQRIAVFLRYYADLSYAQIGHALAISPGTVGASLNAAHALLRQELEEAAR